MLAIERKNEILQKLRAEQRVLVSELAAHYQVTEETIRRAIREGVGKINNATDLELVFQQVTGRGRMPNAETLQLPSDMLDEGVRQVQALVEDRIGRYLLSGGKAD